MKSVICDMLGIEFPLVAFTHCRDVVVEVSKAGGFGVLGAVDHTPESLEIELDWIDEHIDGKPYGVDLIVPTSMSDKGGSMTAEDLRARIPEGHKRHVEELLASNGIDTKGLWDSRIGDDFTENIRESGAALIWTLPLSTQSK